MSESNGSKPTMSKVVKEYETGRKDTQVVAREDGTITVTCGYQGLQKKTITAYPLQWLGLCDVLPTIRKCFDGTAPIKVPLKDKVAAAKAKLAKV